jgi:sporadic carbohydrate cluster 2OG-Fe(II) oxygenase
MGLENNQNILIKNGFIIKKFENIKPLINTRELILNKLKKILKTKKVNFKNYHKFVNDKTHKKVQWELSSYFWKSNLHIECAKGLKHFLFENIGPDLLIQKKPFLRIARPNKITDNIGLHKDTLYGQTPYEMAVHIPFLSLNKKACLKFASRTHLITEKKLKFKKTKTKILKGSKDHKLGKPYDPKIFDEKSYNSKSMPIKFGEYVFFTPALIHGQSVNSAKYSRFSIDLRVVNKFSPIKFNKGHNSNYIFFNKSNTQILVDDYLIKNKSNKTIFNQI